MKGTSLSLKCWKLKVMTKWNKSGRVCSVCDTFKSWENFSWKRSKRYKDSNKIHQLKQPKCKDCAMIETTSWKESQSPERLKDLYYKRQYGLSLHNFNKMFAAQNGQCILCKKDLDLEGISGDRAVVDHCHTTGKVRGILCNECNRGLGYFKDNINTFKNAIKYLSEDDLTSEGG